MAAAPGKCRSSGEQHDLPKHATILPTARQQSDANLHKVS